MGNRGEHKEMVDIVDGKNQETIDKGRPVLKSLSDIESAARKETRKKEGDVLFEDEWMAAEAKNIAKTPDEQKAQTRKDAGSKTPEKSDKVDEEGKESTDGKPEGSEDEGKKEGEQEEKEKPAEGSEDKEKDEDKAKDAYSELRSKTTKVEQENSLLRDMLVQYRDTAKVVNELQKFKDDVKPFLPVIETIKDIRSITADVQVPEDEMSGLKEETGERFATEADKMKILAGSEKGFALLVNKAVARQTEEYNKVKTEQQQQCQRIVAELQNTYNEGKPFDKAILTEISNSLGGSINSLNDPSVSYDMKKAMLKSAVLEIMMTRKLSGGELTKAEITARGKEDEVKASKAQLQRSKSTLKPKKELTPEQKKYAETWLGIGKVLTHGKLPLDIKK